MFCSNCGGKINSDAKFCAECGSPVEAAGRLQNGVTFRAEPIGGCDLRDIKCEVNLGSEDDSSWVQVEFVASNAGYEPWHSASWDVWITDKRGRIVGADHFENREKVAVGGNESFSASVQIDSSQIKDDPTGLTVSIMFHAFRLEIQEIARFGLRPGHAVSSGLPRATTAAGLDLAGGSIFLKSPDDDGDQSFSFNVVLQYNGEASMVRSGAAATLLDHAGQAFDSAIASASLAQRQVAALEGRTGWIDKDRLNGAILKLDLYQASMVAQESGHVFNPSIIVEVKGNEDGRDCDSCGRVRAANYVVLGQLKSDWHPRDDEGRIEPSSIDSSSEEEYWVVQTDEFIVVKNLAEAQFFRFESEDDLGDARDAAVAFVHGQLKTKFPLISESLALCDAARLIVSDDLIETLDGDEGENGWHLETGVTRPPRDVGDWGVIECQDPSYAAAFYLSVLRFTDEDQMNDPDLLSVQFASEDNLEVDTPQGVSELDHEYFVGAWRSGHNSGTNVKGQDSQLPGISSLVQVARDSVKEKAFYFSPDVPPKLGSNAVASMIGHGDISMIHFLVDSTLMGSAKDGLMLYGDTLFAKDMGSAPVSIPLADIESVDVSGLLGPKVKINGKPFFDGSGLSKKPVELLMRLIEGVAKANQ